MEEENDSTRFGFLGFLFRDTENLGVWSTLDALRCKRKRKQADRHAPEKQTK